jgi:hypothetical protein
MTKVWGWGKLQLEYAEAALRLQLNAPPACHPTDFSGPVIIYLLVLELFLIDCSWQESLASNALIGDTETEYGFWPYDAARSGKLRRGAPWCNDRAIVVLKPRIPSTREANPPWVGVNDPWRDLESRTRNDLSNGRRRGIPRRS